MLQRETPGGRSRDAVNIRKEKKRRCVSPREVRWPGEFLETDEHWRIIFQAGAFTIWGPVAYGGPINVLSMADQVTSPSSTTSISLTTFSTLQPLTKVSHLLALSLLHDISAFLFLSRFCYVTLCSYIPLELRSHYSNIQLCIFRLSFISWLCLILAYLFIPLENIRSIRIFGKITKSFDIARTPKVKRNLICINAVPSVYFVKFARGRAIRIFGLHWICKCLLLLPWEWEFTRECLIYSMLQFGCIMERVFR